MTERNTLRFNFIKHLLDEVQKSTSDKTLSIEDVRSCCSQGIGGNIYLNEEKLIALSEANEKV